MVKPFSGIRMPVANYGSLAKSFFDISYVELRFRRSERTAFRISAAG
jgi:hypothetical protein